MWEMGRSIAGALFLCCFALRYLRTAVSIITYLTYQPKPPAAKPAYTAIDTTVIVPTTFKAPGELIRCLKGITACRPALVVIVTSRDNVELVKTCCALNSFTAVQVLGVDKLNKRRQMLKGLERVKTAITVFVDDDVFWPERYLDYLLAVFEDPLTGAGGTRQRAHRRSAIINHWDFLGISYLERRVWNNISTNAIDGSLSTLSGRTAGFRSSILQTPHFRRYFESDSWNGRRLNSDDDKCLTRYLYANGWRITLQADRRSTIETTFENDSKYLSQCLRWARAHWRGNLTVMLTESYWRSPRYCWGAYVIYLGQFQTPSLLCDLLLAFFLCQTTAGSTYRPGCFVFLGCWILFTKIVKLIPHFSRHPQDLRFLPLSLVFGYLHGVINIYALLTLNVTVWGSQQLDELEVARAEDEEVLPLLREAIAEAEQYQEPTPGKLMVGEDYFSARPMAWKKEC